ncbi:hypothetical protein RhiJN_24827 [Ceratobasidium sp. AG-Ba]|nr:hypothetical protein RhiJN_24827 [Ceratobasidium sp. AG-Ba]
MSESQPRSSARSRRPTDRLTGYDPSSARLTTLAKSLGREDTPPPAESQAAEQRKKQESIAKARGNTSLPGPLKPLKRQAYKSRNDDNDNNKQGNEEGGRSEDELGETDKEDQEFSTDEDEDGGDDEAGPSLLEYRLEDLEDETDCVEWLHQAIRSLGDRNNYRNNPNYQEEGPLRVLLKQLREDGPAPRTGTQASKNVPKIQKGQTHILQPQTSGHSSRAKLVCTDHTTLGLDGQVASPGTEALRNRTVSNPMKRLVAGDPAPSKKRVVVPLGQIQALRKEQGKAAGRSASQPALPKGAPKPSQSMPRPPLKSATQAAANQHPPTPPDVEMRDPSSDLPDHPPFHGDRAPTPPIVDDDEGAGQGAGGGGGDNGPNDGDGGDDDGTDGEDGAGGDDGEGEDHEHVEYGKLTKRQRAQLKAFSPEVRELVQCTADHVKLDLATICPFPECMREAPTQNCTYLKLWMLKYWVQANNELREGQPILEFTDDYAAYIRNQLPTSRNGMKKSCNTLVPVYFSLRCSDPGVAERAKKLTDDGNERWLSPTRKNDDGLFKHAIICDTIENASFKSPTSFGFKHIEHFTPLVPIPMMAYACSIIRHQIKSYEVEAGKATDLNLTSDSDAFSLYMKMLEKLHEESPGHLLEAHALITHQYLQARPKPTQLPVPEMNIGPDCEIDMERLEEIRELLGEDAPEIEEWDAVWDVQKQRKGKAPVRG